MSPEEVRGEQVDARSDIFSFGVMLYEMISGRQPFICESAAATASAILTHAPPPLMRYASKCPEELQRVVRKCLEKDRERRCQTMRDVAVDLENYVLLWPRAPATGPTEIRSLAVLPLANLSGDPAQDYFADGMTEALITKLAQVGELRVISRTSVMQYKGARKNGAGDCCELSVDAVVARFGTAIRRARSDHSAVDTRCYGKTPVG